MNEISDVYYFKQINKPTDRGSVLEPDGVVMDENLLYDAIKG